MTSSPEPPVALIGTDDLPSLKRLTAEQCNKWRHATRPWYAPSPPPETLAGHVENPLHRDVPGTKLCRNHLPAPRHTPHNYATGHSTGSALLQCVPAQRQAAARAISVVTDLPIDH